MAEQRKTLAIIDGKSVFYRGYYAMPNLSTKDGTPTGGVYGFAVMALEVLRKLNPDYVCIAWDKPKTNIRSRLKIYPEYKAGRKPAPPDFYEQIPILHELLKAFGWPLYELDDYEADDIMGTLAVQARAKNIDTALITSDLDMLQVINGNVSVYALKKGLSNIELFHPTSFKEKYGIEVDQFLDLKSIKGDSSDNIPGVPGIGEKGAVELLKQFKTLDGIYENLALVKESARKKLEAGKELAYLSKKLAAIWTDAPIKLDLKEVDGTKCDPLKVQETLQKLEFKTLARQLPDIMQMPQTAEKSDIRKNGLITAKLEPATSAKELNALEPSKLYFAHGNYSDKDIKTLAIVSDKKGLLLSKEQLAEPEYQKALRVLAGNQLIGFDTKTLIKRCWAQDADICPSQDNIFDIQIAAFLLNPLVRDHSIASLAREYLDLEIEAEELDENQKLAIEISVIQKLYKVLGSELKKQENLGLAKVFEEIDMPIIPVLADMEFRGIKLDVEYLNEIAEDLEGQISDIKQEIYGHADEEFNISSPQQLATILFEKLNLPKQGVKKGKTGYSTAAGELEKLRGLHPIIDLISHYREMTKLMSTYIEALPRQVDENNRLHTTFNMTVAQTGRLSSADPNLQNIPVRTDLGKKIRRAFVADKGNTLINADYSQIELRLASVLAKDKNLIDMFNRDVDVHTATAAQIYGREAEDVTKNMRREAKVVNFGIMYGLGPHGLAVATGMTREHAKDFIEKYFEMRPTLLDYIKSVRKDAVDKGYVETLFGRRRPTPDVKSSNFMVREAAMRAAVNMPFQGTAADLMKTAMIKVQKELQKRGDAHMLLQIHDSILVECPEKEAPELAKKIKKIMEEAHKLPVKLTVDTSIGKNWGEL